MKRLFAVLLILLLTSAAAHAAGPFFGLKLGMGIGFHENGQDMENLFDTAKAAFHAQFGDSLSINEESRPSFVLLPYGGYYFTDKFAIQTELNFMFAQKKAWILNFPGFIIQNGQVEMKYSSLDIPLLIRFDFLNDSTLFGILAGPYVSIPMGNIQILLFDRSNEMKLDKVTTGFTVGVYSGFVLGPGRFVGDIRFNVDFVPVTAKIEGLSLEMIKRRGINITLGYEFLLDR